MAGKSFANEELAQSVAAEYERRNPGSHAVARPFKGGYGVSFVPTGKASVGNRHWLNESVGAQYVIWANSRVGG
jgi:hypothetical protein